MRVNLGNRQFHSAVVTELKRNERYERSCIKLVRHGLRVNEIPILS